MANPKERRRLAEKSNASIIFRGKKSLYPSSWVVCGFTVISLSLYCCRVQVPFIADRLRIRTDERWTKLVGGQKSELRIIWADLVQKMNRTDAKVYNYKEVPFLTNSFFFSLLIEQLLSRQHHYISWIQNITNYNIWFLWVM